MTLSITVNNKTLEVVSEPDTPLIFVLRDELKMKGTKLGCGLEQCGACAVLVDGEVKLSCVSAVETFKGKHITTIEGIGTTALGRRVQDAFVATSAAQCGYCTAGLVVATTGLLSRDPMPDNDVVTQALNQHLCRCGSYPRVFRAVAQATES